MTYLRMMFGAIRMFWGWCPRCNSDAPRVDRCPVCKNAQGKAVAEWLWWKRFKDRGYR
jgi:predicted amidophosphoribosyltransferase